MRIDSMCSSSLLVVTSILVSLSLAASSQPASPSSTKPSSIEQPITHPIDDDVITAGTVFTITWKPDRHFSNVTLELWDKTSWGYSRSFGNLCYHYVNPFCGTIVSHAPNTGSYEWRVPKPNNEFPRGQKVFGIKMYVDDFMKPEINNRDPVLSYSQNFAFALEPGQLISVPESSSSTTSGPSRTMTPVTGYAYVTIHDGVNITLVPPKSMPSRTTTVPGTGIQSSNTARATTSQGGASGWHEKVPAILPLLLWLM